MSYESEKSKMSEEEYKDERLKTPLIKYFWEASPLSTAKKRSLHKFLRRIDVFNALSDFELRTLSKYMHKRVFDPEEILFNEGESSFGFYLIYSGTLDVYTAVRIENTSEIKNQHVTQLGSGEFLGELALLERKSFRNASAVARTNLTVMALFKPDLDELIERHPVVAARLLQALSLIVARRFTSVVTELRGLKEKVKSLYVEERP